MKGAGPHRLLPLWPRPLWPLPPLLAAMASLGPPGALGAPPARGPAPAGPPSAALLLSCSGLVAFVLLLLTCLCCKRGDLGFKELESPDGAEDSGEFSAPGEASSGCPSPSPEVFVVPLEPPPAPPGQQQLSLLQEIGTAWFGKVILGELRGGPGPAQVVLKELRAGAGTPERRRFLAEAEPYRTLRHPNLLRCLGGCRERPLLLVWEYCQMGDLKRYLRAQRGQAGGGAGGGAGGVAVGVASSPAPPPGRDLGTLERLALEVTRGLRHLHQHGFVHSDLALRNVLLTSELTARIGDYGLGPAHYREDYFLTPERALVPLRWVAPELVTKGARGTLEVAPQSRESNVWALGVTLWELLEWGAQPLPHLSDLQLLGRLRSRRPPALPPPRAAPAWSELLQSCRLPPPQRPTLDQLHARLSSLLARRPQTSPTLPPPPLSPPEDAQVPPVSPFPLLDALPDAEDVLTVTQDARGGGLALECLWERGRRRNGGHRWHRGWWQHRGRHRHRHRGHRRRPRAVPAGGAAGAGGAQPLGGLGVFRAVGGARGGGGDVIVIGDVIVVGDKRAALADGVVAPRGWERGR
ncbi:serine/threonine-protein kinase LMTK3-like isoform X3 [Agelaius tricolor]|uniref:serine/threonine-protein kinase LMTK3-like isoform X3 n=1 Tax=Agelaius tricolor TaxID=9191 RepID=UPI0039F1B8E1